MADGDAEIRDMAELLGKDYRSSRDLRTTIDAVLRGLAGDVFDDMISSLDRAIQYLSHTRPSRRLAAIDIITNHFRRGQECLDLLMRIADTDADAFVRASARLCILSTRNLDTHDWAKRYLAQCVCDDHLPEGIRVACYSRLHGDDVYLSPECPYIKYEQGMFRFPDDVAWAFVRCCLQGRNGD